MNAEWLGDWRLGPRAHPGDGLLDLTEGQLGLRDRLHARRRAPTGDHVPHPGLRTRRAAHHHLRFERPVTVRLDGARVGRFRSIEVTCEPDSLIVVV
jgi:diacylglycerol kinase family enzyme